MNMWMNENRCGCANNTLLAEEILAEEALFSNCPRCGGTWNGSRCSRCGECACESGCWMRNDFIPVGTLVDGFQPITTRCGCDMTRCGWDMNRCDWDMTRCDWDMTRCDRDRNRCGCDRNRCDRDRNRCDRDRNRCGCDRNRCSRCGRSGCCV